MFFCSDGFTSNVFVFPPGLSKSLGLIEGYGGRGKGGLPATLSPEEEEKAKGPHEKYGYNSYLSEKISLDRSIPDYRPTKYVPGNGCVQCHPEPGVLVAFPAGFGAVGSSLVVHRALLSDEKLGWLGWNELMESQDHPGWKSPRRLSSPTIPQPCQGHH